MPYTENAIPDGLSSWKLEQALRYREKFKTDAYVDGNVLRWKSNNAVVPLDILRDAYCTPHPDQAVARDRETEAFLAEYRERRKNYVHSAEELFEMRATFGPGTTVVDVITGQRTKL